MKKLIAVAVLSLFGATAHAALPGNMIVTSGLGGGLSAGAGPVAVGVVVGVLVARNWNEPVPYHLTSACKAETVKAKGGNYSYSTFEGCLKK